MKRLPLILAGAVLAPALVGIGFVADRMGNDRRIASAPFGRDALMAACGPALSGKLREAGFEPGDIDFGGGPALAAAAGAGRMLRDSFTFQDGAVGLRVDGVVACVVEGGAVTVDFRTSASPVRTT